MLAGPIGRHPGPGWHALRTACAVKSAGGAGAMQREDVILTSGGAEYGFLLSGDLPL